MFLLQGDFGILAACFQVREGGSYATLQLFEPMDALGTPLRNEYDCPLLSLTCLFRCIPVHSILQSVSIIHQCSPTCTVQCVSASRTVEILSVPSQTHVFMHDFSNNLYSYNIYCMHSVD